MVGLATPRGGPQPQSGRSPPFASRGRHTICSGSLLHASEGRDREMWLIWSPEARDDLIEIFRYVVADNPRPARRLQETIKQGAAVLRDNPSAGRTRTGAWSPRMDDDRNPVSGALTNMGRPRGTVARFPCGRPLVGGVLE